MNEAKESLVSIIIPTYGRPEYLKRAIKSVLNQTYKNIEIIVVDDNDPSSPERDATELVMEEYVDEKKVIYLKHAYNKNGSAARNTGIHASSGEYISFLDDDDEMLPERIEKLVHKMNQLDEMWGGCYSNFIKLKPNNQKNYCTETRTGNLYVEALMRSLYFCPGSNLLARSKAIKDIGGFDEDFRRNQDMEFIARFLEHNKLAFVDDVTLIIHYEDKVTRQSMYENLVSLDDFYIEKFSERINKLSPSSRKKVYQYIAMERLRYSIKFKKTKEGLQNCLNNKVSIIFLFQYAFYMGHRFLKNQMCKRKCQHSQIL